MSQIVTETGSTMRSVFANQPLAFALVMMNIALMVLFWFVLVRIDDRAKTVAEDEKELRKLLASCIVPAPGMKLQSDQAVPFDLDKGSPAKQ